MYIFIYIYTHTHTQLSIGHVSGKRGSLLMHIYRNTKRHISATSLQHTT